MRLFPPNLSRPRYLAVGALTMLLVCSACDDRGGTFSGTVRLDEDGELTRAGTVSFIFDVDGRVDGHEIINVALPEENALCRSGAEFDSEAAAAVADGDEVEVTLAADTDISDSLPPGYGASQAVFNC